MIVVTAGIIWRDKEFLIAQRKKGAHLEYKWEFPGGKLEEGESPEACLTREIMEELGIRVDVQDIFKVVYFRYPSRTILLLCYTCRFIGGNPQKIECNDFRWIDPQDIYGFDFAPADLDILEKIKETYNIFGELEEYRERS